MSLSKILLQYEPRPKNLLSALKNIQKTNNYISMENCKEVAKYFSLPLARVFTFASFFDEIRTRKPEKKVIRVCSGGPCMTKESAKVARQIEKFLKIEAENDAFPKWKLEYISCRGLCDQGPVMMIDDQVFEKIKPEDVDDILINYL